MITIKCEFESFCRVEPFRREPILVDGFGWIAPKENSTFVLLNVYSCSVEVVEVIKIVTAMFQWGQLFSSGWVHRVSPCYVRKKAVLGFDIYLAYSRTLLVERIIIYHVNLKLIYTTVTWSDTVYSRSCRKRPALINSAQWVATSSKQSSLVANVKTLKPPINLSNIA